MSSREPGVAEVREWRNRQFGATERERRALSKIDGLLDRLEAKDVAFESIIVRCREGDERTNWLPTIARIAEEGARA